MSFSEISQENDLVNIQKFLQANLPRSTMLYNVLRIKIELTKVSSRIQVKIFTYGKEICHDQQESEIFIVSKIKVEGLPQTLLVAYNPNNASKKALDAFERLIDWTEMNQFEGIENNLKAFIENTCQKHGIGRFHGPIELYYMDRSEALRFDNETINFKNGKLSILNPQDAKKIDSRWLGACPGSLKMLQASIEAIGSGGVYMRGNSDGDQDVEYHLVSWAVALPFGSIHALHTEPDYQRRGYAGLTMKTVSKAVATSGRIPCLQIYKANEASNSKLLNQKIGFILSHDISLIHYFPLPPTYNNNRA